MIFKKVYSASGHCVPLIFIKVSRKYFQDQQKGFETNLRMWKDISVDFDRFRNLQVMRKRQI